jgi:anti-sigma factor RsiW
MSCRKIDKQLAAYIDGELGTTDRAEVETHLAACTRCKDRLSALTLLRGQMESLPRVSAPAGFSQRLKARIKRDSSTPPFWRRAARRFFVPFHIKVPLELAAAAAAVALVVIVVQPRVEKEAFLTMEEPVGAMRQTQSDRSLSDQRMAAETTQPPPAVDRTAGLGEEAPRFSQEEGRIALTWAPRQKSGVVPETAVRRKAEPAKPAPEVKGQGEPPVISFIRRVVRQRGGSISAINRDVGGNASSLLLEIPADSYPAFISDLSRHGEFFQAPPERAPDTPDGTIKILLRLHPVKGD